MIKLHFEKLSRFDRVEEPCTAAIPFPKGELKDLSKVAIVDGEKLIPAQCRVTAKWSDNSVKWLLVNFLADLPGNRCKDFYCILDNKTTLTPEKITTIEDNSNRLVIGTGELQMELSNFGEKGLFNKISNGYTIYNNNHIVGPLVVNYQGEEFIAEVGEKGWNIIERGPVISIVETRGKHYNSKEEGWLDYIVRIYSYAGKPWIKIDYTIINKEEGREQHLKGIELRLRINSEEGSKISTALATSNYKSDISQGKGNDRLYHIIDGNGLVNEANEHIPETFYGTFWGDWCSDKEGGICATVYQAHQNFPKSIEVNNDGISIGILPMQCCGLNLMQGMAKTHSLFLHFHGREVDINSLNIRSLQMQLPDRPILDSIVYEKAGIFENIFVKNRIDEVERALIAKADSRGKAYGILHWGDAPDPGYTQQGRGNGEPVWTNNEYDFPHAAMLMYVRTGERRMLDYMLVAAEHWKDVDVCHYNQDPLRHQAQIIHSANHVTGDVEISHEWVEGLFDYYHVTGEQSAYEIAIGIGENILRHLSQPRYQKKGEINARETGWALRALVALYKETYDEKWLLPAEKIVDHFEGWREEYGGWLAPYTDHTAIRVPFMISVAVGSLMRYYRIRPSERVKTMIIDAVKDMMENCILDNGLFYYKELPSLRRLGNNTLVLEALTNAYELTGDVAFLKAGLVTFNEAVKNERGGVGFSKQIKGDAVIILGPGPKGFAQSFYPIVSYYAAASEAGVI